MSGSARHRRKRLRKAAALSRDRQMATASKVVETAGRDHVIFGREGKVVLNSGESVPIRYAVVGVDWLITSHSTLLYVRDERYPLEAQPRDYEAERELQLAVEGRASNLDPWQLLSN